MSHQFSAILPNNSPSSSIYLPSLSLSLIVYDRYLNVENTLKHSTIKDYVHIANPLLLSSPPLNKNENR